MTFKSTAFNVTDPKPTFLNPGNFGDDLIEWMANGLRRVGWAVDGEIGQEDDGWYVTFKKPGHNYDVIVQLINAETGLWLVWLERGAGIIPSLLGARKKGVPIEAAIAIYDVIKGAPEITDPRWFTKDEFMLGKTGRASPVS